MAKYHINSKGVAAKCSAQRGNCPFGGESQHYDNLDTAKKEAEKQLAISHAILESLSSAAPEKDEITNTNIPTEEDREQFVDNVFNVFKEIDNKKLSKHDDEFAVLADSLYDNLDLIKDGDEDWEKTETLIQQLSESAGLDRSYTDNVEKFADSVVEVLYGANPFNNMHNYKEVGEAQKIFDNLRDSELYDKDSEIIVGKIYRDSITGFDIDMRDLENGFYIVKSSSQTRMLGGGNYLVYAPDGFDSTSTQVKKIDEYTVFMYTDIEMGLGDFSKEEIREMVDNGLLDVYTEYREMDGYDDYYDDEYGGADEVDGDAFTRSNVREIMYKKASGKKIPLDRSLLKSLAIAKNVSIGNTFIQKNYPELTLKLTGDVRKDGAVFESGMSIVEAKNNDIVESYKNSNKFEEFSDAIRKGSLQEIQDYYDYEDEKDYAIELLEDEFAYEDYKDFKIYSSEKYSLYSSRAHGYRKNNAYIQDYDIKDFNDTLQDFNKHTMQGTRALFRGATTPRGITADEYMEQFNVGDVTITNKPTSTSIDSGVVENFGNTKRGGSSEKIKFIYHTKKGAYIAPISRYPHEEEVILPIGEQMVVVDKGRNENGEPFIVFADNE